MSGTFDRAIDPQLEWLYHVAPVGLVIGPNVIRDEGLEPPRQTALETEAVSELLNTDLDAPLLTNPWAFFQRVLGWDASYVAGAPDGPAVPNALSVRVPEHDVVLSPDWAVRDLGANDPNTFQILVKIHTDLDADKRGSLEGWEASPHRQFERLLRETGVSIGVLLDRTHIRLIYAPRGETSGWLSFPVRSLGTVAGRPMLGGLKLVLGHARLFTEPEARRLPKLLARSREAQNKVSAELAEQVLGALHELLRAFHAADTARIEKLAAENPHHLYEGLLTTLMRLVFLLYAEDRELMPTLRSGEAVAVYEQGYSVRGLYARLTEDRALNPDTMDERIGAWGRLLALFRLVHGGHPSGWITARGGKLFDPDAFPFLEGREKGEPHSAAKVLRIRDGAILRILEGLMTVEARSITGERVRERLSYRSLDVEQIGSVYETIMGFTVLRAQGPMIAVKGEKNLPVFVDIEALAKEKGVDRQKLLKEVGVSPTGKKLEAIKKADDVQVLTKALAAISDPRGSPGGHVTPQGSPVLQPTDERRRSGSHYTPRSLTEPIVRHALEPAFARLNEDATPDQVLDIKVCDPACGSGAFLVEACRQLGERLEKAWARHPDLKPKIPADEEEALHAKRLVAQRSLYGVDKNPLAVDLARLSLWLATLAREHEFSFLDHAIKSGDSLVGLSKAQIQAVNWDASKPGLPLLRGLVRERVSEVITGRREIQFAPDDVSRAIQEARYKIIEKRLAQPRVYGDAIVAAFFSSEKSKEREKKRAEVESLLAGGGPSHWEKITAISSTLKLGEHPVTPFHWELEFPEVFERDNPGFDVIVGNPPFLGGTKISTALSAGYFSWLAAIVLPEGDKADLIAYFVRRIYRLIRERGTTGFAATGSIAKGDTRIAALNWVRKNGGQIYRASRRQVWPGEASVRISLLHIIRNDRLERVTLDGREVEQINSFLMTGPFDNEPLTLTSNEQKCFEGFVPYGNGFVFDLKQDGDLPEPLRSILEREPLSRELIFPFIGGDEITEEPLLRPSRCVIFLGQRSEQDARANYPLIMELLERTVRPFRLTKSSRVANAAWWQFLWPRPTLFTKMGRLEKILVTPRVSKHHCFAFISARMLPSTMLSVVVDETWACFAALQSRMHELWSLQFGGLVGETPRYNPSKCFSTFPFPLPDIGEDVAGRYCDCRSSIMKSRLEGLTIIYNRFHSANEHSPDIERLRALHAEMDRAVLRAYGWDDLADRAEPVFLTEETEDDHTYQGRLFWPSEFRDEVLARLLKLNAERHAEEVRLGVAKEGTASAPSEEDEAEIAET